MRSYEDLEDEVAVLRQRLADVTNPDLAAKMRTIVRLSPQEAKVLAFLYQRSPARKEVIYTACFERDNGEGPCLKIVDVVVCRIRFKMKAARVPGAIETQWSVGYSMNGLMRSWFDERVGDGSGSPTAHWINVFANVSPASRRTALAVLAGLIPEPDTFRNIADRQEALGIAA